MGKIKRVIHSSIVPIPQQNTRLTVELCENVHLHYRNLRLEFHKNEFADILMLLQSIPLTEVMSFAYGPDKFKELIRFNMLTAESEFNDRLQIEEQVEGHYHVHYRNLRIEVDDLKELGIENTTKQGD